MDDLDRCPWAREWYHRRFTPYWPPRWTRYGDLPIAAVVAWRYLDAAYDNSTVAPDDPLAKPDG